MVSQNVLTCGVSYVISASFIDFLKRDYFAREIFFKNWIGLDLSIAEVKIVFYGKEVKDNDQSSSKS